MTELKPCPFCGSKDVQCGELGEFMKGRYFIHCNKCQTSGPLSKQSLNEEDGLKDAIKKWNRSAKR